MGGTGRQPSQKLTLEQGSGKSKNRTGKDRSHPEDNPASAGHLATALFSLNHCCKQPQFLGDPNSTGFWIVLLSMCTHDNTSVFPSLCGTPKGTQTCKETVLCISGKIQSLVNIPGCREVLGVPTDGMSFRPLPPYQMKASCVPLHRYRVCYCIQASRQLWASSAESSKKKMATTKWHLTCESDYANQACLRLITTLCCRSYRNRDARLVNDMPGFIAEASIGCSEVT